MRDGGCACILVNSDAIGKLIQELKVFFGKIHGGSSYGVILDVCLEVSAIETSGRLVALWDRSAAFLAAVTAQEVT